MSKEITGKSVGLTAIRGRILEVKDIASLLAVSERWVHKHMEDGTFPIRWFPFGPRNRGIDSADLDEWLKKIAIEAGTAPLPLKAVRKNIKKGVVA